LIAISHNLPRFRPARPNARWSTLPRRRIAEKPADLEPGVGFFDIGWDGCRWPMTEVVPISDFKFCGMRVSCGSWCSVHADLAIQPRQPRGRKPSDAATAELADVRPPQMKVSKKDVAARDRRFAITSSEAWLQAARLPGPPSAGVQKGRPTLPYPKAGGTGSLLFPARASANKGAPRVLLRAL
jgi:hypothetical protein